MALYAISDIHGALDELKSILKKIDFRDDGRDELYLLGDYGDWGKKSLETILYIKEMDRSSPYIHPLMGNHELMFLTTILSSYKEGDIDESADNWLYANRGLQTWRDFQTLSLQEKEDLTEWLLSLKLSADTWAGGRHYMLAHAYPYFYDMAADEKTALQRRVDAVWRRLMLREDPFAEYTGKQRYDRFICGHTITDYYAAKARNEQDWPYRKPADYLRNHVFRAEKFIDIDCGAKCMDFENDSREFIQMAAVRAQLACLRLDDEKAFYVHRLSIPMPSVDLTSLPNADTLRKLAELPSLQLFAGQKSDTIINTLIRRIQGENRE